MVNCEKCKKETRKIGIMDSGNSKYEQHRCDSCHHTTMRCIGLS